MFDRLLDDLPWRQLLVIPGALALAMLVVLGSAALSPGRDGSPEAVRTDDRTTTTAAPGTSSSTSSSTIAEVLTPTETLPAIPVDPGTTLGTRPATRVPTTEAPVTTAAPPPVTQPPRPPCPGGSSPADVIATRFCEYRVSEGLPHVTRSAALDKAATDWAQTWASTDAVTGLLSISHNPNAGALVEAICCLIWGENVAFNSISTEAAWTSWLNSAHHLDNIRTPRAGEYGVGAVTANGTTYFVHLFGWY